MAGQALATVAQLQVRLPAWAGLPSRVPGGPRHSPGLRAASALARVGVSLSTATSYVSVSIREGRSHARCASSAGGRGAMGAPVACPAGCPSSGFWSSVHMQRKPSGGRKRVTADQNHVCRARVRTTRPHAVLQLCRKSAYEFDVILVMVA